MNGFHTVFVGLDILLILFDPSLLPFYLPRSLVRRITSSTRRPLVSVESQSCLLLKLTITFIALIIFINQICGLSRVLLQTTFSSSGLDYVKSFSGASTFRFSTICTLLRCMLSFIKWHCLSLAITTIDFTCKLSTALCRDRSSRDFTKQSKRIFLFHLHCRP